MKFTLGVAGICSLGALLAMALDQFGWAAALLALTALLLAMACYRALNAPPPTANPQPSLPPVGAKTGEPSRKGLHVLELDEQRLNLCKVKDWWNLSPSDLERVATALVGPFPGGWVRHGDNFVKIGGVKYGADARRLAKELSALARDAAGLRAAGTPEAILRAAVFFHIRFENIHPLCEANGRVGRVVLAMQVGPALGLAPALVLAGLHDAKYDYRGLFATNSGPLMFEMLMELLTRITGHVVTPEARQMAGRLEPLHPQKKIHRRAPAITPEEIIADPSVVKTSGGRPPGNRPFFRKFR